MLLSRLTPSIRLAQFCCSVVSKMWRCSAWLWQLLKVERLSQKLHIMSYIGNFFDTQQHLQPVSDITNSRRHTQHMGLQLHHTQPLRHVVSLLPLHHCTTITSAHTTASLCHCLHCVTPSPRCHPVTAVSPCHCCVTPSLLWHCNYTNISSQSLCFVCSALINCVALLSWHGCDKNALWDLFCVL